MIEKPRQLFILGCSACLLTACSASGPYVDVAWIGDSLASPQNETVIIESGHHLPQLTSTSHAPGNKAAGTWNNMVAQVQKQPTANTYQQPVQSQAPTAARTYVVQSGDTINRIAARQGVSPAALIAANGLAANPNALRVGQVLRIPAAAARVAPQAPPTQVASTSYQTYTVKGGDTLSAIAARHGVSVAAICAANGFTIQQANQLRVGQTIKLPRN